MSLSQTQIQIRSHSKIKGKLSSFEAEPPASRSERSERVGRRGSRHSGEQAPPLMLSDSLSEIVLRRPPYSYLVIPSHKSPVSRAAVARPPNGGDADPDGRLGRARNDRPPRRQQKASPRSKPLPHRARSQTERSREGRLQADGSDSIGVLNIGVEPGGEFVDVVDDSLSAVASRSGRCALV